MSTSVIPFTFESHEVRVIEREGSPWWVLSDVCAVLTIGNQTDASRRLDEDEKGFDTIDTLGGKQSVLTVNESGLWSLVLTSRKPQAKTFKKWLTSVVIPTLRKDGAYIVGEEKISTAQNLSELEAVQEQLATLQISDCNNDRSFQVVHYPEGTNLLTDHTSSSRSPCCSRQLQ